MALKPWIQQFCHAVDAARLAHGSELNGDPPGSIAAFVLPEDVADQGRELPVSLVLNGPGLGSPGVIPSPADFQRLAERSQRKGSLEGELFEECIHIGYPWRLKIANAFFRMSRS